MLGWYTGPEKRWLRRPKKDLSNQKMGSANQQLSYHPDVYPQENNQKEDAMTAELLTNGYQLQVLPMEYDGFLNNKQNTLGGTNRLSIDEGFSRSAVFVKQILQKKIEQNILMLDGVMIKEGAFRKFQEQHPQQKDFFEELTYRKFQVLAKRFLPIKRDEKNDQELSQALYKIFEYKVPYQRVIWFLKMNQVANPPKMIKSKKSSTELYLSDLAQFTSKFIDDFLTNNEKVIEGTSAEDSDSNSTLDQKNSNLFTQQWLYFVALFKNSFEAGIFDRYEFLMQVCDIAYKRCSNFDAQKPRVFTLLFVFLSNFIDLIVQNVFISRKLVWIIAKCLNEYKNCYELQCGPITNASECYNELISCQQHHTLILIVTALLHAIIVDCPAALIWNPLDPKVANIQQEWIAGSPFDFLPHFFLNVFTQHLPKSVMNDVNELIQSRILAIKNRSENVEHRWSVGLENGSEKLVKLCLDIVHSLDTVFLDASNIIPKLYNDIFYSEPYEKVLDTMKFRIRIIVKWATTAEREGFYRALIVCELLKFRVQHYKSAPFGSYSLQTILLECLEHDSPKPDSPNFHVEFSNLVHLFVELQRYELFNHDLWVRDLIHSGQLNYQDPIFLRLKTEGRCTNSPKNDVNITQKNVSVGKNPDQSNELSMLKAERSSEVPAIISFIPDTPTTTASIYFPPPPKHNQRKKSDSFALLPEYPDDNGHIYMDSSDKLTFNERLLFHLPIEQIQKNRDICNQRSNIIYGISTEREMVRQELNKLVQELYRIWQKRLNAELSEKTCEIKIRKRESIRELEAMISFYKQTYYDQLIICGYCADNFIEMLRSFVDETSISRAFPIAESLEVVCSMFMECQCLYGLLQFALEVLPLFKSLEETAYLLGSEHVPGQISSQLTYVIVTYLAEHLHYFLNSGLAIKIVNCVYGVIEAEVTNRIRTCWTRSIAIFLFHIQNEILDAELDPELEMVSISPIVDNIERIFPSSGEKLSNNLAYNPRFLEELFCDLNGNSVALSSNRQIEPRRFYGCSDYENALGCLEGPDTYYSFVVNAFIMAYEIGDDYDKLSELANVCSHISSEKGVINEWYAAIQELVVTNFSSSNFSHLLQRINISNYSKHYSLSTFILLLASKYCFSIHALICRLLQPLIPIAEKHAMQGETFENGDGLCLMLYIISCLLCATDRPFIYCGIGTNDESAKCLPCFGYQQRALRIIQIKELDKCIFPLLSFLQNTVQMLKMRSSIESGDHRGNSNSQQLKVSRCALYAICEQEWVVQRVFRLCDLRDIDVFNTDKLIHNSIGNQLLRNALRRKSERRVKRELMESDGINKVIINKLLSELTIWNMRATEYDFKLLIKEALVPPENQKGSQSQLALFGIKKLQHYFGEIANSCRLLFDGCTKEREYMQRSTIGCGWSSNNFYFTDINCFWLFAPLIGKLPTIETESQGVVLESYFLTEAASLLSEGLEKSIYLLSYQPFINLLLACAKHEIIDTFIESSIYNYLKGLVNKVIKSPSLPYQTSFTTERECLLLYLNLIGNLFDCILARQRVQQNTDWAFVLFQLLYYDIITSERDGSHFDTCFDMLNTLCHAMFSFPTAAPYERFVAKVRKECTNISDDMQQLSQLLPIAKSLAETTAWDYFHSPQKVQTVVPGNKNGGNSINQQQQQQQTPKPKIKAVILDRQPQTVQQQIIRLLYHNHYYHLPRPGVVGQENSVPDPFLAPPEMEEVSADEDLFGTDESTLHQQQQATPSNIQHQQMMVNTPPSTQQLQHLEQQQIGLDQSNNQRMKMAYAPANQQQSRLSATLQQHLISDLQQPSQYQHQQRTQPPFPMDHPSQFIKTEPQIQVQPMQQQMPSATMMDMKFGVQGMTQTQTHLAQHLRQSNITESKSLISHQHQPQVLLGASQQPSFDEQMNVPGPMRMIPEANILQQQHQQQQQLFNMMRQRTGDISNPRSDPSTPTTIKSSASIDSPRNSIGGGGGRGGRRKNVAGMQQPSTSTSMPSNAGRKRKQKDITTTTAPKSQHLENLPGHLGMMDIYSGGQMAPGMPTVMSHHLQAPPQQQNQPMWQQHIVQQQQAQLQQTHSQQSYHMSQQHQQFVQFQQQQQQFSQQMPKTMRQQLFSGMNVSPLNAGGMGPNPVQMSIPPSSSAGMMGSSLGVQQTAADANPKKQVLHQKLLQKISHNQHPPSQS